MVSNDKLKEIELNNRTYYYFHDIIKIEDFDLDNILIDEKSYKNILVQNVSYKSLIDYKSLHIRFDKTDGFIRVYDGARYLILFKNEKYDSIQWHYIYNFYNYATIKVDSFDSLPVEKTMTFRNVIIYAKSVWNRDKKNDYCNIFLEKGSYELPKK